MQKRRQTHHPDDPKNSTRTVFLSEEELKAMEFEVEKLRGPIHTQVKCQAKQWNKNPVEEPEDTYEPGMRIPASVLNECNDSFLAADECRQKASAIVSC